MIFLKKQTQKLLVSEHQLKFLLGHCVYIPEREEAHGRRATAPRVTVFCASSSSGPSVLPNTNDQVLIPEGLPIREIIPPLSLPSAQHCFAFRSGYCDPGGGDSGMNGCCRPDGIIHKCTGSSHLYASYAVFVSFFFFFSFLCR